MTSDARREEHPVVIIGAGPAGISAAVQLAKAGVRSVVIDENPRAGGVVYRGPSRPGAQANHLEEKWKERVAELQSALEEHAESIDLRLNTQVLGPMHGVARLALLENHHTTYTVDANRMILCTGCYEWTAPFPGWTLPGVMAVGGVQLQIKNGLVKPGQRAVLVGTGPLLLVAARQMHLSGIEVLGVYEAGRRLDLVKNILALLKNNPLLIEGLDYIAYLEKARIPLRYGWGIVETRGKDRVEEVVVAPYDKEWRPNRQKELVVAADLLATEHGLIPRTQLAQLLGVEHTNCHDIGLKPVTDPWGRTSREGIYVAGDAGGVYGAQAAVESGRLAALAYLVDAGRLSSTDAEREARPAAKRLSSYIAFRDAFDSFSKVRPGLLDLPSPDTLVCRCENVTRGQVDEVLASGVQDITTVKMTTRAGMGDCQGKICSGYLYAYLRDKLQRQDVGQLRPRFPLALVTLGALLSSAQELETEERS
jgi:hydrogen cyanide synthase HcnB